MNIDDFSSQRRSKGAGSLIVRRNTFWCRIRSHGQEHYFNTGIRTDMTDEKGRPCARRLALAVLDDFSEPFMLKHSADTIAVLKSRYEKSLSKALSVSASASSPTLGSLFPLFEKSMRRNEVSKARLSLYVSELSKLAKWAGGEKTADLVTESVAEKYAEKLWSSKSISPETFNSKIVILRHVWKVLAKEIGSPSNPWECIKRKQKEKSIRRPLTREEVSVIYEACGDRFGGDLRVLMTIGANTGLRLGDCATLKWSEIDFKNGVLRRVTRKTGASVTVPLLHELRSCLESHRKRLKAEYKAAREMGWSAYWRSKPARNESVRAANTPDERRTAYICPRMCAVYEKSRTHMAFIVSNTFKSAGITTSKKEGRCSRNRPIATFHSFRHVFASRLAEAGVSERTAMQLLGHQSSLVHDHYVHLQEDYLKQEMMKLEKENSEA